MKFLENTFMVLSDIRYLFVFILITAIMMFIFGVLMQVIFLSPRFVIVPSFVSVIDMVFFFLVPIFSSLVITMMIYRVTKLRAPLKKENKLAFLTSTVGLVVSACTCSGFLIPLAIILGSIGMNLVFITAYLNEIRIAIMVLLVVSFYYTAKNFLVGCKIKVK